MRWHRDNDLLAHFVLWNELNWEISFWHCWFDDRKLTCLNVDPNTHIYTKFRPKLRVPNWLFARVNVKVRGAREGDGGGDWCNNKPTCHKADPARTQMWNGTAPIKTNLTPQKKIKVRNKNRPVSLDVFCLLPVRVRMSHTLTGLVKTTNHQLLLSLEAEASSLGPPCLSETSAWRGAQLRQSAARTPPPAAIKC